MQAQFLDGGHQRPHRTCVLHINVEARCGQCRKELVKRGNWFQAADPCCAHKRVRKFSDDAVLIRGAAQSGVMADHGDAVSRSVDVRFDVLKPQLKGRFECHQGVFQAHLGISPVRDGYR